MKERVHKDDRGNTSKATCRARENYTSKLLESYTITEDGTLQQGQTGPSWGTSLRYLNADPFCFFPPRPYCVCIFHDYCREAVIKHLNEPRFEPFSIWSRVIDLHLNTHSSHEIFLDIYFQWLWAAVCSDIQQSSFGLLCAHNLESIDPISSASPAGKWAGQCLYRRFQGILNDKTLFILVF